MIRNVFRDVLARWFGTGAPDDPAIEAARQRAIENWRRQALLQSAAENVSSVTYEFDPAKCRVDIGMPVGSGYLPFPTAASLVETIRICTENKIRVRLLAPVGSSIVTDARSAVVDEHLAGDATHLFWIDADMCWEPREFFRLLTLCVPVDVVGATYAQKLEPLRFMVRKIVDPRMSDLGLVEVEGLPLGFCCMKRKVVERVAKSKPLIKTNGSKRPVREVFRLGVHDGNRLGEDMAFFEDVRSAGHKVWLNPAVNVFHVGMKLYGGDVFASLTKSA